MECTSLVPASVYDDLRVASFYKIVGASMTGEWREALAVRKYIGGKLTAVVLSLILMIKAGLLVFQFIGGGGLVFGFISDLFGDHETADKFYSVTRPLLTYKWGLSIGAKRMSDSADEWIAVINKYIDSSSSIEDMMTAEFEASGYRNSFKRFMSMAGVDYDRFVKLFR